MEKFLLKIWRVGESTARCKIVLEKNCGGMIDMVEWKPSGQFRNLAIVRLLERLEPKVASVDLDKLRVGWFDLDQSSGFRAVLAFMIGASSKSEVQAVLSLPHEVLLYWFTLCNYGYRQKAARKALKVLLTHKSTN